MLSLIQMWISFSTMVGGGVRGKSAGIAHATITPVGSTIKRSHHFIQKYHHTGEMTTGIIAGGNIPGTTSEYPINNFNRTGATGKRTGIGRNNRHGVSKV
jgi:hypothetical protein